MATNLLLRRYQYMIQTSGLNYHKQIARALGSSQEFLNILAGVPSSTGTVGGDDGHDQPNPAFQRWDALAYERETFVLGEEAKASGSPAKQRVHEVMVAPQRAEAMEKAMAAAPKSIWLWGPPGSGKHFVMDMTFDAVPKEIRKVRYSFPTFMQLIHETSKELLARGEDSEGDDGDDECHDAQMDPVPHLVRAISDTTDALFLEDFEICDVIDAMLMRRLFLGLFANGVPLYASSWRAPDSLYQRGPLRARLLPFLSLLVERCDIVPMRPLGESAADQVGKRPLAAILLGDDEPPVHGTQFLSDGTPSSDSSNHHLRNIYTAR